MVTELSKKNKSKKLRISVIFIILLLIAGGILYSTVFSKVEANMIKASKNTIAEYIEETGEVKCLDDQIIYSDGAGIVTEMTVETGDSVTKNGLLLRLDTSGTEIQLKEAKAKISAAMAQLKGTDIANYANLIEIAKCEVENSKIAYDKAARDYENAKKLYENNAISREQYKNIEEAFNSSNKALSAAQYNLAEIEKGTAQHIKDGYKAQLEQAFAARDALANQLSKLVVNAPFDGVVMEKYIEINSFVTQGTQLFKLGNPDNVEIVVNILSDEAHKVKIGSRVEISGKAVDDKVFQGKVTKMSPSAKSVISNLGVDEKRVEVKVELLENSEMLKPGYDVDVNIITAESENTLVVPDTAVFEYNGKDYVFVVENETACLREVKKGIESEEYIEILEGLKENDLVIDDPEDNVKEGVRVKSAKS